MLPHQSSAINTKASVTHLSIKSRPKTLKMVSFDAPRTPEHSTHKIDYGTPTKSAALWAANHRPDGKTLDDVATEHGISYRTLQRWLAQERRYGSKLAQRRTRRPLAELNQNKLGRPWTVDEQILHAMADPDENSDTEAPLTDQAKKYSIRELSERTLQRNFGQRLDAHMYKAPYTMEISEGSMAKRAQFGLENQDLPILGLWDRVFFTDEAHFNPWEDFQPQRQLRRKGAPRDKRVVNKRPRKPPQQQRQKMILHMYAAVNWYTKSKLYFYNDEAEMPSPPKRPAKPRKRMYETPESLEQRIREWEATLPPKVNIDVQGNHMTQKYYTEHVLPQYIKLIKDAERDWPGKQWILQEDNDPSHGTRSQNNVARDFKRAHNIRTYVHPAQSPDLNPCEACWKYLKQKAKRRLHRPQDSEEPWDGSKGHLKKLLQEIWAEIPQSTIRSFIQDMPARCNELANNGGQRIRTKRW